MTHHVLIVIVCSLATKSACNVSLVVVKELAIHSATVVVFAARSKEYVLLFAFYCAVLALPRVLFPLHAYIISLVVVKELAIHSATVVIFWGKIERVRFAFLVLLRGLMSSPRFFSTLRLYYITERRPLQRFSALSFE